MNIHIKNEKLFKQLLESTLVSVEFGSSVYGLKSINSDTDVFHIYAKSDNMEQSIIGSFNNLQFKHIEGVDHIFCTLDDFIMDIIYGRSNVSFEVLHLLNGSSLSWLYEYRALFNNYENAKAYIGVAKRDCKYYKENDKKLSHAYRSVEFAKRIIDGSFDFKSDIPGHGGL
jgi:hypothetical protein